MRWWDEMELDWEEKGRMGKGVWLIAFQRFDFGFGLVVSGTTASIWGVYVFLSVWSRLTGVDMG